MVPPSFEKPLFDQPQDPAELVTRHLESTKPDAIIASAIPPERRTLMVAAIQQVILVKFLGGDVRLYPMRALEEGTKNPADLPKVFIYHGRQDSVVPDKGPEKSERTLKGLEAGEGKIHIRIQEGDHGFDSWDNPAIKTPWPSEGLEFVTGTWLA